MQLIRFLAATVLSLWIAPQAFAEQVESRSFIDPAKLPASRRTKPNFAFRPAANAKETLLVFLPGTGAETTAYTEFMEFAAASGYFVVGLDYINGQTHETLCDCNDACYDHVMEQLVDGASHGFYDEYFKAGAVPGAGALVQNSVKSRLVAFLRHLHWDQFIQNGEPAWSKIVVAGHSQGGHLATWILDHKNTKKALTFSSPSYTLFAAGNPEGKLSHARECAAKGPKRAPSAYSHNAHLEKLRSFVNVQDPRYDFGNGTQSEKLDLTALFGASAEKHLGGACPSESSWLAVNYSFDPHGSTVANGATGTGPDKLSDSQRQCIWRYMLDGAAAKPGPSNHCEQSCSTADARCMSTAHDSGERQACVAELERCRKACP